MWIDSQKTDWKIWETQAAEVRWLPAATYDLQYFHPSLSKAGYYEAEYTV